LVFLGAFKTILGEKKVFLGGLGGKKTFFSLCFFVAYLDGEIVGLCASLRWLA
jgi:hypothetical protein